MQGHPDIIATLNELLVMDQTAADLYRVFAGILDDRGLLKLRDQFAHEADHELLHVKAVTDRILFLEGTPNVLGRLSAEVVREPKAMLEASLRYEVDVARRLNEAIGQCDALGDAGTRRVLEPLLVDTESDHIFWLESQLALIEQIGLANYLSQQLEAAAPA